MMQTFNGRKIPNILINYLSPTIKQEDLFSNNRNICGLAFRYYISFDITIL